MSTQQSPIDDETQWRTYQAALQRFHNEDRILAERTNFLLLGNAFLFTGFAALESSEVTADVVRITVPAAAICLALLGGYLNFLATRSLSYFQSKLRQLRATGAAFEYMRTVGFDPTPDVRPGIVGKLKVFEYPHLFVFWVPMLLIAVWISSLVWVVALS